MLTQDKATFVRVAKDPQRHLVYEMERNDLVGMAVNTSSSRMHLQDVTNHACDSFCVPRVKIKVYNNPKERIYGHAYEDSISLNKGYHGANMATLIHELAHYLEWHVHESEPPQPDHGPRFMGYYVFLADRYKLIPAVAFKALCDHHGVKYDDLSEAL